MKGCTVFQNHLIRRTIPWNIIQQRLQVHRTAPCQWARGSVYPNKPNADALIGLFAEYGVELDYNDIYRLLEKSMDEAS